VQLCQKGGGGGGGLMVARGKVIVLPYQIASEREDYEEDER